MPKVVEVAAGAPGREHVLELLAPVAEGRDEEDLLFTTCRQDRPWSGATWRVRGYEALDACPGGVAVQPAYAAPHSSFVAGAGGLTAL